MSCGTVLLTGVGRRRGIAAGIALALAGDGWDLTLCHWPGYDERVGLEHSPDDAEAVATRCRELGAQVEVVAADLADPEVPERLVREANRRGDLTALVLSHAESVDSAIRTTTVESWDRHFAVNARASWLLIRALAEQLDPAVVDRGAARVVALTSDHTAYNLPYGASKGALDRLVVAAAHELADLGVRANVVNPGPIDTGWMTEEIREAGTAQTPLGRLGTPQDTADLVRFLLSEQGGWITGQLLHSNGGFRTAD
ncbi:3-oxoacyl-[acyl-carrier protein] reductase [Serinicoccus hydrothermalis]|uniref:3-oxoacyl-[acyl-carrier protein] reductase n=1 Tax=Serinicoccus hydrothermalis TaxID=1758689 RepID=A0A1B1NC76_9MICO|nr:SDR family oxidoreductase [Serinicoccus hydrothermalis]ANS79033.1 3-oxoacyl-[acyl-carrier protein] reductase [Serinicoccus hydrothermalis]